ncbi:uncharacterized protein LOC125662817 [Ostrea edulis]|uniref:uncharacterized protein LOC125662817 n=1 Tax=Ostrea edulis TaxID=37623 RepID=UPI00209618C9|nr:uncharacterized protein LOC125662817 [Ostrea edulis]
MKTIMISALQLVLILCIAVTVCSIQNVARESTHVPFTSCNNQGGISTVLKCYRHCMRQRDVFYMIGHDPGMEKCYCCHSAPGIDDIFITGEELQTYITGQCPMEYTAFQYGEHRICLRYVESSQNYLDAVDVCSREGGDVIRLDTEEKHDILRLFVEGKRQLPEVEVWVQGIYDNGTWRYHDGSEFTYTCLNRASQDPAEIYMRARSQGNYNCNDAGNWRVAFYVCEMYIPHAWFLNSLFV